MKPRVYIETTIPSYLTARPSRQVRRQAHQEATRAWWGRRHGYELFVSRLVIQECSAGDPEAAAERLAAIAGLTVLDQPPEADALAKSVYRDVPLPTKARLDAQHVAVAAVGRMDYLLTWNCRHIANATLRARIEAVCRAAGYEPPVICTPDQFPAEEDDDDA